MKREQVRAMMPTLQAFVDGKDIEGRPKGFSNDFEGWVNVDEISGLDSIEYRIKPEPKYRPFNDQEECWNEMHKHPDFGWVKAHNTGHLCQINCFYYGNIGIDCDDPISFRWAFDNYTFADGAPFGVNEE